MGDQCGRHKCIQPLREKWIRLFLDLRDLGERPSSALGCFFKWHKTTPITIKPLNGLEFAEFRSPFHRILLYAFSAPFIKSRIRAPGYRTADSVCNSEGRKTLQQA